MADYAKKLEEAMAEGQEMVNNLNQLNQAAQKTQQEILIKQGEIKLLNSLIEEEGTSEKKDDDDD